MCIYRNATYVTKRLKRRLEDSGERSHLQEIEYLGTKGAHVYGHSTANICWTFRVIWSTFLSLARTCVCCCFLFDLQIVICMMPPYDWTDRKAGSFGKLSSVVHNLFGSWEVGSGLFFFACGGTGGLTTIKNAPPRANKHLCNPSLSPASKQVRSLRTLQSRYSAERRL